MHQQGLTTAIWQRQSTENFPAVFGRQAIPWSFRKMGAREKLKPWALKEKAPARKGLTARRYFQWVGVLQQQSVEPNQIRTFRVL
jgi:hypothetical protein